MGCIVVRCCCEEWDRGWDSVFDVEDAREARETALVEKAWRDSRATTRLLARKPAAG